MHCKQEPGSQSRGDKVTEIREDIKRRLLVLGCVCGYRFWQTEVQGTQSLLRMLQACSPGKRGSTLVSRLTTAGCECRHLLEPRSAETGPAPLLTLPFLVARLFYPSSPWIPFPSFPSASVLCLLLIFPTFSTHPLPLQKFQESIQFFFETTAKK